MVDLLTLRNEIRTALRDGLEGLDYEETGCGVGFGGVDIGFAVDGIAYELSIRPLGKKEEVWGEDGEEEPTEGVPPVRVEPIRYGPDDHQHCVRLPGYGDEIVYSCDVPDRG
jgi:hypothetical protein